MFYLAGIFFQCFYRQRPVTSFSNGYLMGVGPESTRHIVELNKSFIVFTNY